MAARKSFPIGPNAKAAAGAAISTSGYQNKYGLVVSTGNNGGFDFEIPVAGGAVSFSVQPLETLTGNRLLDDTATHKPVEDGCITQCHGRGDDLPFFKWFSGGVQTFSESGTGSEAYADSVLQTRVTFHSEGQFTRSQAYPFERCTPGDGC